MPSTDIEIEQNALREVGVLGRTGPYGNELYAITYQRLPPEAKNVLETIMNGGPLLYPKHDGNLYGNRSRELLGNKTFREFTVPTPVEDKNGKKTFVRGRRRLVISDSGLLYFTACHYERVPGEYGAPWHKEKMEAIDEKWRHAFYIVSGLSPSQREKLAASMQRIHNARLPVLIT